jgi:ribose 5-phosphate isomerase B
MKVGLGSDHAGYELKEELKRHLLGCGVNVEDCGTSGSESVDYPDFAFAVAHAVAEGKCDYGVLVCSTGIGMCIAANKMKGIRAALAYNESAAVQSRAHLDSNILVFGQKYTDTESAVSTLDLWLSTPFEGGRHERRVGKIKDFEDSGRN